MNDLFELYFGKDMVFLNICHKKNFCQKKSLHQKKILKIFIIKFFDVSLLKNSE